MFSACSRCWPPTATCPAEAITARGAPFCYPLPGGFVDSSSLKNYGGGWQYETLVSAGTYDLVEVLGGRLPFDSSSYADAQLRAYADPRRYHAGDPGLVDVTALRPTTVAGSRTYVQIAGNNDGARLQATFVFHGKPVSSPNSPRTRVARICPRPGWLR
jgi:hypothetical protein